MKAILFILALAPLLLLTACGGRQEAAEATPAQVRVEDFHYTKLPGGARFVSGRLHNPTAEPIRNALIQISLFDAHNRFVSSMSVTVQDVPPGRDKPFRQPVDADEAVQAARVRGVLLM